MDEQLQRWHEAERAVRELERKVMIAHALERSGSLRTTGPFLEHQLVQARAAADLALQDCLHLVAQEARTAGRPGPNGSDDRS